MIMKLYTQQKNREKNISKTYCDDLYTKRKDLFWNLNFIE